MTSRRALLTGLVGFVACAPAIVRATSVMPVRPFDDETTGGFLVKEESLDDLIMLSVSGVNAFGERVIEKIAFWPKTPGVMTVASMARIDSLRLL